MRTIFNKVKGHNRIKNAYRHSILLSAVSCYLATVAYPAMAHHMIDNQLPASFFEGFASGLAHPIIGFDHCIFIFSIGLLAAIRIKQRGWVLPPAYVVATTPEYRAIKHKLRNLITEESLKTMGGELLEGGLGGFDIEVGPQGVAELI